MSLRALQQYVEEKMPELDKQLGLLPLDVVRQVMNAMTGLSVSPSELKHQTCAQFLSKLKQMEENGTLYSVGLDAAIKKIQQIKQGRTLREES